MRNSSLVSVTKLKFSFRIIVIITYARFVFFIIFEAFGLIFISFRFRQVIVVVSVCVNESCLLFVNEGFRFLFS